MKHCEHKRNTFLKRLLSLLLCLCMLSGTLCLERFTVLAADRLEIEVRHNGSAVDKLTLPQEEKAELTAVCSPQTEEASYQWQILADAKTQLWVNIYDGTKDTLSVSYPMTDLLLDESGSAYIRCTAQSGDGSAVSEPVCVTISFSAPVTETNTKNSLSGSNQRKAAPRRSPAQEDETEYLNISVNYLDAVSGLPIYTGFTAQIERGTAYQNTVISPTYLGYAAYYNAAQPDITLPGDNTEVNTPDDASVIRLNVPADYEGAEYKVNVYYKTIDVPYSVRYFFQNINDDMYTMDAGLYKIGTAKTGTIISDTELAVDDPTKTVGFTKLYHYPEAVAADGSTAFECYYDRNYYMLKFDANGGYGVEPIYARYGTPFLVNDPTRHGYVFAGWDLVDEDTGEGDGVADTLPATVPAESLSYKALWHTAETTYTVVYWLQNADDDDYSYIGSEKKDSTSGTLVSGADSLTADSIICGNTDAGHTHSDACKPAHFAQYAYSHAGTNVEVQGDGSTVVNVYYKRHEYTLRFFYARQNSAGNYYVVGGSTYNFGNINHQRPSDYNIDNLLANVPESQWGQIKTLPEIKEKYKDKLTAGMLSSGDYTYYYLELKGRYGEDLTESFPGDVFERVEVSETHTDNGAKDNMGEGQWGNYAYLAGWNGEFKVKYSKDNSNSTIKGMYQLLDDNLLYDPFEGTSDTVNFLSYFGNGANISWNQPWKWIYEMYVPVRDGEMVGITYSGVGYKLFRSIETSDNNAGLGDQTHPTLNGFTYIGGQSQTNVNTPDGRTSYTAQFFYERQNYNFTMHNYGTTHLHAVLPFHTPLDAYAARTPDYPETLEENAYTFGGWYYSPGCFDGTEYKQGDEIPSKNTALYAKWTPVKHTVRFFRTYDDMIAFEETGDETGMIETHSVTHGEVLGSVDNPIDNSGYNYTFGGWFYMKNNDKTAYTPLDMPVVRDMNVFADWGSHTAQPYLIHYVLQESETSNDWLTLLNTAAGGNPQDNQAYTVKDGTIERTYVYLAADGKYHQTVAQDTAGYAYQGNTRTFYPKAGDPFNQLFAEYNSGYFPTLASHSITIAYEESKEVPKNNVFTFTYVHAQNIKYRVEYRYQDTGELIPSAPGGGTVTKTTSLAVVTERFAVITDYIPDAFYKRLIIALQDDGNGNFVGADSNVVTFYYTRNETNAFYVVHHMLQNFDAESDALTKDANGSYVNYTDSGAYTEGIGQIGTTHDVPPQTFSGFTVRDTAYYENGDPVTLADGSFNISVAREGTVLYIFYTRNTQNVRVYHLRYGTDISNPAALTYTDGSNGVLLPVETDTGRFGTVYTAAAETIGGMNCVSPLSQSITLQSNNDRNYIVFFYSPLQYTAEYKVWAKGGGSLDRTIEVIEGTNVFAGSTATAQNGYRFDGWYLDEECTVSAGDKAAVTGNTCVPITARLEAMPKTNVFYAKFTPIYGMLTVKRTNADDEGNGDRTFVYRITSPDDAGFEMFVTVTGNDSVTVKDMLCRRYVVEQQNGWSWRYADAEKTVTVTEDGTTVTFDGAADKDKWLNGNGAPAENRKG